MKELGKIINLHYREEGSYKLNQADNIPFKPKRAYWIYDVPGGESRGGHAHKQLQQVIIAAKGSFTVNLDNGVQKKQYLLDSPSKGLYLDTKIWRTLDNFSPKAVCLVLASELYNPKDYLYDYNEFIDYIKNV